MAKAKPEESMLPKTNPAKNAPAKNDQKRTNPVSPKKILDSKWTAVFPRNREKHFVVMKSYYSSPGVLDEIELEAVYTGNTYRIHWRELKDGEVWRIGWK